MTNTITPIKNGPLKVEADSAAVNQGSQTDTTASPAFLCRCGSSANKPYCDGAHSKQGFRSERDINGETVQHYPGQSVSVQFNRSICSGAARCVSGLPAVFRSDTSDHWIHPDQSTAGEIERVINACPSGALSMRVDGHDVAREQPSAPVIDVVANGPYLVEGLTLENTPEPSQGNPMRYALCRCGLSKNKPYCDYSHAEHGWTDAS